MKKEPISFKTSLQMKRSYLARSCKLHYEVAPVRISHASKQYMYDDAGQEYLDCVSNVAHVGHCHPHVVSVGQQQMAKLSFCAGFLTDSLATYAKRLVETFPDNLNVCYFINSGSEANDLALRLARAYTKHNDVIVVENSYHGHLTSLVEVSPLKFGVNGCSGEKKDYVHIVSVPDMYRCKYTGDTPQEIASQYAAEVDTVIQTSHAKQHKIAAFMSEALMSANGVIIPPPTYLKQVYSYVHAAGGVCIADEIGVGLGRVGDKYWSFELHDVIPDIVTCGKVLGNGHPMAAVITTREIADTLLDFSSGCGGNPVSCAVGVAVLDVIKNELLMSSAKFVGRTLMEGLRNIQHKHPMLGDIRGHGLVVGIEIVVDKESRKPSNEAAGMLSYKLKENHIILSPSGPFHNVMMLMPPLCFTVENARRVVSCIDLALGDIEAGLHPECGQTATKVEIPLEAITSYFNKAGESSDDSDSESDTKYARYEDLD